MSEEVQQCRMPSWLVEHQSVEVYDLNQFILSHNNVCAYFTININQNILYKLI